MYNKNFIVEQGWWFELDLEVTVKKFEDEGGLNKLSWSNLKDWVGCF